MRVLLKSQCLLFVLVVILTTYTLSASAGPAKDKKKLLDKLRTALNHTDSEAGSTDSGAVDLTSEPATPETFAEGKIVEEDESSDKSEELEIPLEEEKRNEVEKNDLQKNELSGGPVSYLRENLVKMRSILKRLFDMFGFRQSKKKDGRQNRMMSSDESFSYNGLEYEVFRDDIRTTVGAVLGEKECIQKIVCGAGSYLRSVNGKNVILTILENVTPTAWLDTMEVLKKSAITDGDCQYKCLENNKEDN